MLQETMLENSSCADSESTPGACISFGLVSPKDVSDIESGSAVVKNGDEEEAGAHELPPRYPFREWVYLNTGVGAKVLVPSGKRFPFLTCFNIGAVLFCFSFFFFNAVNIFVEYMYAREFPATRTIVKLDPEFELPSVAFCSSLLDEPFNTSSTNLVFQYYDQLEMSDIQSAKDLVDHIKNCDLYHDRPDIDFDCQEIFPSVRIESKQYVSTKSYLEGSSYDNSTQECLHIHGFPGWTYALDADPENLRILSMKNAIIPNRLWFYFNMSLPQIVREKRETAYFVGVQMLIFADEKSSRGLSRMTELLSAADQMVFLGAEHYHTAALATNTMKVLIPPHLQNQGSPTFEKAHYNIDFSSAPRADGEGNVDLHFGDPRIIRTEQYYPSFSVAFGSLGGWMGLLSDGWGLFSVMFMIQKFVLLRCKRTQDLYWYTAAQDKRGEQADALIQAKKEKQWLENQNHPKTC